MTPAEKQRAYRERQLLKARDNLTQSCARRFLRFWVVFSRSALMIFVLIRGEMNFFGFNYLPHSKTLALSHGTSSACSLTCCLMRRSMLVSFVSCELNAGPVMPVVVAYKRRLAHNGGLGLEFQNRSAGSLQG